LKFESEVILEVIYGVWFTFVHIPAYSTTKLSSTVYEVKEEIADNTNTGQQIKKLENKVESDEFTITRQSHTSN
jgi:hypothetical protein